MLKQAWCQILPTFPPKPLPCDQQRLASSLPGRPHGLNPEGWTQQPTSRLLRWLSLANLPVDAPLHGLQSEKEQSVQKAKGNIYIVIKKWPRKNTYINGMPLKIKDKVLVCDVLPKMNVFG